MLFALIYLKRCVWIGRTSYMNWQGKACAQSSPLDISHHKHNNMIYDGYCTFGGGIPIVLLNKMRISWANTKNNISKWYLVWKIKIFISNIHKIVCFWCSHFQYTFANFDIRIKAILIKLKQNELNHEDRNLAYKVVSKSIQICHLYETYMRCL